MKCPKCRNKESEVDSVVTGPGKFDYILACIACPWQVAVTSLETWIAKWRN